MKRINSSGLSHLVMLVTNANTNSSRVVLAAPSPFLAVVFNRSKLEQFFEVAETMAEAIGLRGRVFRTSVPPGSAPGPGLEGSHPIGAVRLERTRDGEHHGYVLLVREVSLGSGPEDALALPHESVRPGHARLALQLVWRPQALLGKDEASSLLIAESQLFRCQ